MNAINVLVVEDEVLIAETIKVFLGERGHRVVGMAISYEEAVSILEKIEPGIVLLDIRLYGQKSGLDVAEYIKNKKPHIPFVVVSSQYDTAFIQKAMEVKAAGYITKPLAKETLWSTIELAVMKHARTIQPKNYVDLKVNNGTQRIRINEILYIKSDHVYVEVHCVDAKYYARYNLNELLERLNSPQIQRCHRSYIVNTTKIDKFNTNKIWIGNHEIPISNKYKDVLKRL